MFRSQARCSVEVLFAHFGSQLADMYHQFDSTLLLARSGNRNKHKVDDAESEDQGASSSTSVLHKPQFVNVPSFVKEKPASILVSESEPVVKKLKVLGLVATSITRRRSEASTESRRSKRNYSKNQQLALFWFFQQ